MMRGKSIITNMIFLLACACKSMALWILIMVYISHYSEGLGTPAITVKNGVGVLRLLQPTFVGRNVTFEFTPSSSTSTDDIRLNYIKRNGSVAKTIEEDNLYVQREGQSTVLTIPDVDRSFNGTSVYTSIGNTRKSPLLELNLKVYTDADGCGELYFLSEGPYFAGDNLSLGYFPSPQVAKEKNTSKYSVKLINGSNADHTPIVQSKGVLELDKVGHEFIFTLFNVRKYGSGHYWIQCLDGVYGMHSNGVQVSIKGKPIIGPLTTISTCRECIVFKTEQTLGQVYCETDEEYNATNVEFKIGLIRYESFTLSRHRFGLNSFDKPADAFHQLSAICTVFGVHRNMSVEASIYIVEKPTVVVSSIPVIPVPPNTTIALTCDANAHPVGNITWTTVETSTSKSSQLKTCSNASTCTYEMTTSDVEQVYSCYAQNEHGSDEVSIVIGDERGYNEDQTGSDFGILGTVMMTAGGIAFIFIVIVVMHLCLHPDQAKLQLMNEDNTIQLAPLQPPPLAERDDVTHAHTGDAEYAGIHRKRRNLENVALPSRQDMPSCDAMNESFENATTESTLHIEQQSNENSISVETGPDVRRCQSKEHLYTTDNENDNGISMQNQEMNSEAPHAEGPKRSTNELVYADVDIEHLEKFRVRIRACNDDESTEYSDIVFGASCRVKPDSSNENVNST